MVTLFVQWDWDFALLVVNKQELERFYIISSLRQIVSYPKKSDEIIFWIVAREQFHPEVSLSIFVGTDNIVKHGCATENVGVRREKKP